MEEFDRRLAEVAHRVDVELVKDIWGRGLSVPPWDRPAARAGLAMVSVGQAGELGLPGGKVTWGTAADRAFALLATDSPT